MSDIDRYPALKSLHVAAALVFVGGVLAETILLSSLAAARELTPEQRHAVAVLRVWDARLVTPAMITVWALGISLALWGAWFRSGWLIAKLAFVVAVSAVHGQQSATLRRLAGGTALQRSQRWPVLILLSSTLAIALLAVIKPF